MSIWINKGSDHQVWIVQVHCTDYQLINGNYTLMEVPLLQLQIFSDPLCHLILTHEGLKKKKG